MTETENAFDRPEGWELFADNTAGTAIYRRDEQGYIIDLRPNPNNPPGYAFSISGKNILVQAFEATDARDLMLSQPSESKPPWFDIVPDIGYDRKLLQFLYEGKEYPECASILNIVETRLRNRISELRKQYGPEIITYQRTNKKRLMDKK